MSAPSSHTGTSMEDAVDKLLFAIVLLDNETLKPMQRKLREVNINRAQCAALVTEYEDGLKDITVKLHRLIRLLVDHPSFRPSYHGQFQSCLYSLAEVGRCLETGAVYISSCAVPEIHQALLKLNPLAGRSKILPVGNRTFSLTSSSLLQEFLFYLDVVLVRIQLLSEAVLGPNYESRPDPKFEWCAECCRLTFVNQSRRWFSRKQHALLQASSAEQLANKDTLDIREQLKAAATNTGWYSLWTSRVRKQGIASYLMQLLEEATTPDSLPSRFKLDFKEIKEGAFLGNGTSGYVAACEWQGEDVVIKFVKGALEGPKNREKFEREVSILASLQHPNAVRIFGFGYKETKGEGFIVMEKMEASLSSLLRKNRNGESVSTPFPLDVNLGVLLQIIEGMCYLRERNLMHRDLKPENILINRPDSKSEPLERFYHVKIADFGTSKFQLNSHYNTPKLGTRAYMAPEMLATIIGDEIDSETYRGYTWKADVYSFGIMCSEILTGKRPFDDISGYAKLRAAVLHGVRPPLPASTPSSLKLLIEECWNPDPEKRPDVWTIRKRLWECRLECMGLYQFRKNAEAPPSGWQGFCTRLDRLQQTWALQHRVCKANLYRQV